MSVLRRLTVSGLALGMAVGCARPAEKLDPNVSADRRAALDNSDGSEIIVCPGGLGNDATDVQGISVDGEILTVAVQYSGGCEDHDFTLCWDGSFLESYPVQVRLRLAHDAHGDACEALISQDLTFDLEPLRTAYEEYYQRCEGTIILHLDDHSDTFTFPAGDSPALDDDDDDEEEVILCPPDLPGDEVVVQGMRVDEDTLAVDVQYAGGCKDHSFVLCWNGSFMESYPVQARLHLGHDARGDACEALISEELRFDMTPLQDAFEEAYQTEEGTIILRLLSLRQPYVF